ncbi:MAG TPA: DNA polymerase III subunit gamma/tau [Flavobacterium sp.]|uniref:DNA polymerase III subunit gamma/tau n=1 Tax=Flavobacterium sp. TaxID=239 RepID=UPI002C064BA0|nr:DNA polymerase III subunit gamma/tau [Flavobacterium sp.]HSD14763.1 DNA polymerase III subunit gamma/tau [Flavobacterium sp.]
MEQFIVSARKYRPQTFKDVVGQQAITNTLLNAIENNHLAQALLFTGPRGVGKTTCARILARKINQEGYDDPYEDFTFNVFELDAASNNSVDDIRNLIDQVRIPPQTGKYKVYIIDEVHMLSTSAFNAFLKTLEEPPRHAIFILATTEKHKIIPTILSRCQIFDFKRITVKDAKEHLAEVAASQNITFEDDALHIIAQKADGAMRDALSIFDRVVSFCGSNLTRVAVTENLNVLDFEYYIKVTDLILENKIPELLLAYNDILAKGFDGHHFVAGLASHFRDLWVCKNPATLVLLEAGEHAQNLYREQSQKTSQEFLLQGIELANECDLKYKVSQNQRLLVELCLMQLASITFDGEKKKAESFIIPPTYYRNSAYSITEVTPKGDIPKNGTQIPNPELNKVTEKLPEEISNTAPAIETIKPVVPEIKPTIASEPMNGTKVSALSLASIRAKRELEASQKANVKHYDELPKESFTETEMLLQWTNFAQKLSDKGQKIMATYMLINDPTLDGFTIKLELPNEGSKVDFDANKNELLGYLRGKLHNHDIVIDVHVNEVTETKYAFTPLEKFEKLKSINPAMELLRRTFDLDV